MCRGDYGPCRRGLRRQLRSFAFPPRPGPHAPYPSAKACLEVQVETNGRLPFCAPFPPLTRPSRSLFRQAVIQWRYQPATLHGSPSRSSSRSRPASNITSVGATAPGRITTHCTGLGVSRWRSFLLAGELDIVGRLNEHHGSHTPGGRRGVRARATTSCWRHVRGVEPSPGQHGSRSLVPILVSRKRAPRPRSALFLAPPCFGSKRAVLAGPSFQLSLVGARRRGPRFMGRARPAATHRSGLIPRNCRAVASCPGRQRALRLSGRPRATMGVARAAQQLIAADSSSVAALLPLRPTEPGTR